MRSMETFALKVWEAEVTALKQQVREGTLTLDEAQRRRAVLDEACALFAQGRHEECPGRFVHPQSDPCTLASELLENLDGSTKPPGQPHGTVGDRGSGKAGGAGAPRASGRPSRLVRSSPSPAGSWRLTGSRSRRKGEPAVTNFAGRGRGRTRRHGAGHLSCDAAWIRRVMVAATRAARRVPGRCAGRAVRRPPLPDPR